jgi:hypothetical protein
MHVAFRQHRLLPHEHQERPKAVDKVRVYYDRAGNTLSVWFEEPKTQHFAEEIGDHIVLMKDRRGRVIGFQQLNYLSGKVKKKDVKLAVEVECR